MLIRYTEKTGFTSLLQDVAVTVIELTAIYGELHQLRYKDWILSYLGT